MNNGIEKSVDIAIGNRRYRIASDDDYLSQLGSRFEPQTVRLLETLFTSASVVLDVGANIGCTSILFGEAARRVIAFEPSPSTFEFLRRNVERAGLRNIDMCNFALGARPGPSRITFARSNRAGGFVSDNFATSAGHVTESISVRRLDDVVRDLPLDAVDLVKIDVEGFEKSVLDGGRETIARFEPIVALELNHWCLNAFQRICVPDFLDYLGSVFPLLMAVEGDSYLDLHDPGERYIVMYHHINHFRYANLVGAFSSEQIARFLEQHRHST